MLQSIKGRGGEGGLYTGSIFEKPWLLVGPVFKPASSRSADRRSIK